MLKIIETGEPNDSLLNTTEIHVTVHTTPKIPCNVNVIVLDFRFSRALYCAFKYSTYKCELLLSLHSCFLELIHEKENKKIQTIEF